MNKQLYPLVSIIVPFYNCAYVNLAISSLINQTYPNIEIIVIDDGSTCHQSKLHPYLPYIKYFKQTNGGTASALNKGFHVAKGNYIAWLSSDDLAVSTKISRQISFMQQNKARICYTDYHLINATNRVIKHNVTVKFPNKRQFIRAFTRFCPMNGSTIMMTKDVANEVGNFDEQLSCAQDYDYWVRIMLAGIEFHYLNEVLTLYRWHNQMGTLRKKKKVKQEVKLIQDRYAKLVKIKLNQIR